MILKRNRVPDRATRQQSSVITKPSISVIQILGAIITDGELSGGTIVLRVVDEIGETSGITIQVPLEWEYSSCLEAISSDTLDTNKQRQSDLADILAGLIGAKITLFNINPTNVILGCGSIRIEKKLSNRDDSFQLEDRTHNVRFLIGRESCVKEPL